MATLPNMGIELPKIKGDRGAWDAKINTGFAKIDAHDHTAGKGLPIKVAALEIDTDLPMNGRTVDAAGKIAFSPIVAPTSGFTALFVNVADNELYYRTAAGANIKITSGAGINISLLGGIVGDYSTVGAEVAYDDGNKRYTFKQQGAPKPWARLASGPVRIYEHNTTESVYVEHAVAAALAAPYTVTWPAALPVTQQLMQISASGQVVFSNTLAVDQNLELVGTAYIKRGEQDDLVSFVPGGGWYVAVGAPPSWSGVGGVGTRPGHVEVGASNDVYYTLGAVGHDKRRVLAIEVYMRAFTSPTTLSLWTTAGANTAVDNDGIGLNLVAGATVNVPNALGNTGPHTLTLESPYTNFTRGEKLFLRVQSGTGGARMHAYRLVTDVV